MRIANILLCHKDPGQVARLLRVLQHPHIDHFIHLDRKVDIEPFRMLAEFPRVHFIQNRINIRWAGSGTYEAAINAFEEIQPKGFDYINLMSGQDFPVKNIQEFYAYVEQHMGTEFITCESVDDEWVEAQGRVRKYNLINWSIPGKFRIEKIANRILPPRVFPLPYKIVGRSIWLTFSQQAVDYILKFLRENPKVKRYFYYCWGADEFIFATILYNSPFKDRIERSLVYVDWTGRKDGHPRILLTEDFEKLRQTDKFFARKFDPKVDSHILDLLESHIQQ